MLCTPAFGLFLGACVCVLGVVHAHTRFARWCVFVGVYTLATLVCLEVFCTHERLLVANNCICMFVVCVSTCVCFVHASDD